MPPRATRVFASRHTFAITIALALITGATVLLPHSAHADNTGLVGYWSFDEGTSTIATDFSGNGNHGTLSDDGGGLPGWVSGKRGKALQFSQDDNYVDIPAAPSINLQGNMTVCTWTKYGDGLKIIGQGFGATTFQYALDQQGGNLVFSWANAGLFEDRYSPVPFVAGRWYHICATRTGTDAQLYLDSVPLSMQVFSEGATIPTSGFGNTIIGYDPAGVIDDVRIYNRALSASEVAKLYQAGATLRKPPNNLGLVGYWSFDEGTSTKATDFSGNGNTGTLTNISDPPTAFSGWTNGKRGKALQFDGSSDYVGIDGISPYTASGSFTVGFWFRPRTAFTSSSVNTQKIYEVASPTSENDILLTLVGDDGSAGLLEPTGSFAVGIARVGGYDSLASVSTSWEAGVWHHAVISYSTVSGAVLYIDGVSNDTDPSISRGGVEITDAAIGSRSDGAGLFFNGTIDDVRVYNRALSATEVAKLYGSGAVKFTTSSKNLTQGSSLEQGLVGLWTFDGADLTDKVYDRSGSNNHGYFNGGATSSAKIIGKLGQALTFDGVNDYVGIADSASFDLSDSGKYAWALWMKPDAFDEFRTPWVQSNISSDNYFIINAHTSSDPVFGPVTNGITAAWNSDIGEGIFVKSQNNVLATGRWDHVVVTYDGSLSQASRMVIYINGVDQTNVAQTDSLGTAAGISPLEILIGASGTPGEEYDGTLDDVRIYNRALTAAEVQQLYQLGGVKIRP